MTIGVYWVLRSNVIRNKHVYFPAEKKESQSPDQHLATSLL